MLTAHRNTTIKMQNNIIIYLYDDLKLSKKYIKLYMFYAPFDHKLYIDNIVWSKQFGIVFSHYNNIDMLTNGLRLSC